MNGINTNGFAAWIEGTDDWEPVAADSRSEAMEFVHGQLQQRALDEEWTNPQIGVEVVRAVIDWESHQVMRVVESTAIREVRILSLDRA